MGEYQLLARFRFARYRYSANVDGFTDAGFHTRRYKHSPAKSIESNRRRSLFLARLTCRQTPACCRRFPHHRCKSGALTHFWGDAKRGRFHSAEEEEIYRCYPAFSNFGYPRRLHRGTQYNIFQTPFFPRRVFPEQNFAAGRMAWNSRQLWVFDHKRTD